MFGADDGVIGGVMMHLDHTKSGRGGAQSRMVLASLQASNLQRATDKVSIGTTGPGQNRTDPGQVSSSKSSC